MSYTINHYNGTLLTTVADGTVDSSHDITLIGKNYAGYGPVQNENFVYLLENFANTSAPPNPIAGQLWFDSGLQRIRFYDGSKFRTASGAEIGTTFPSGQSVGDLFFKTDSYQLYAYTGNSQIPYQLIGPQAAGTNLTNMVSATVQGLDGTHSIIKGVANGNTIFVISSDDFQLDATANPINGFLKIHQGITLINTMDDLNHPGHTTTNHRFWGTAADADSLGGIPASSYLTSSQSSFNTVINFTDQGYTVGSPSKLSVYNASNTYPTIQNTANDTIYFLTKQNNQQTQPLTLKGNDCLPGASGGSVYSNLGSISQPWGQVYAQYYNGTVQQADKIGYGGGLYAGGSIAVNPGVVNAAMRDTSGNLAANVFSGTATSAQYADLAEKYLADHEYDPGTVVCVGGPAEIRAAGYGDFPIGVISTNPAFMMNKDLEGGTYVALKGRVPVKIIGPVCKGDLLISTGSGYGRTATDYTIPGVFAVSLEDSDSEDIRLVECVIL